MADVTYLEANEEMPDHSDDEPSLTVEASDDGRFFGTGWGRMPTGETVFYASLAEDDVSLERALAAAQVWAARRGVMRIWVQTKPYEPNIR
jgi:hypothetical protein